MAAPAPELSWCERPFRTVSSLAFLAGWLVICWAVWFPGEIRALQQPLVVALNEHRPINEADIQQLLTAAEHDPASLALAAACQALHSHHEAAIALFDRLPRDAGAWEYLASAGRARRFERLGDLDAAEREARQALSINPDDVKTQELLGHLLQIEGRVWEGGAHFFAQIQRGKCRGDELLGVANVERFFRTDERMELVLASRAEAEPSMNVGRARRSMFVDELAEAERLLRQAIETKPELGEAQGRLGRILLDRGDPMAFATWLRDLPPQACQHPEVWYVRGMAARQAQDTRGACRCFLEALALSPNHLGANTQVSGCLQQLQLQEPALAFKERAERLSQYESLINLAREDISPGHLLKVADLAGKLGRHWEAAGWCFAVSQLRQPPPAAREQMRYWLQMARRHPQTLVDPEKLPRIDREQFPLPRQTNPQPTGTPSQPTADEVPIAWDFVDNAQALGVDFTYFEGTSEHNRLEHIFNVMGGGAGAVDYNLDGWPDLYLTQGKNWRDTAPQPEWIDRLFRNRLGQQFDDVTGLAHLGDAEFSHGITAGDYDQDGFTDLYIGNLGPNRLYHNNGDGTFTDVTSHADVAGNDWSTSSVFADLNGDALPDLYVLNYTLIEETVNRECGTADNRKACTPDVLPAADDRLYLNLGDGRFRDISTAAGIRMPEGKGLAVMAWDFEGNGRLGLFIANDTTPNFLFLHTGTDAQGVPHFEDAAVVRGVAYDVDGNAQASMGIAAGDVTGDGRIDIAMTDFYGSAIDFYVQRPDGFFDDRTRAFHLREPSLWMLGFACHFDDLDGDGWQDLMVTNGHVDQKSSRGTPDRMPPQLFRNRAGQRFTEIPGDQLGPFFRQGYLGRGMALWDWNRDGRTDLAISHLHSPVAIVTNQTTWACPSITIRLLGRTGCREPTGAVVRLLESDPPQIRLQTAGDGFLASNERRLVFANRNNQPLVSFEVQWPDGHRQIYENVPGHGETVCIEGRKSGLFPAADLSAKRANTP